MNERPRTRRIAYVVAVLAPAVSLLARLLVGPEVMDERALYIAFCPAVMIAAYLGGLRPGLLATFLGGAAVSFFFLDPPYSFWIHTAHDAVALAFFVLVGAFISSLSESLHRSRARIAANERRYAVTLASIGDAVLATDIQARVTFLNPAAEALTGWPQAEAVGRPLVEVFRIINEETRQPAEDPAAKVLRLGTVVGLANHTALLARDGRETPIDDCGAPIIDERGGIAGVVLVFRDMTQRRRAEEAEVLRRANARLELALCNSNIYVWELDMPDGVPEDGRLTAINLWEQLGHERPASPSDEATTSALLHPDDRAPSAAALRGYLAGEAGEYEIEFRLRHKDGSYRWMLSRGVAVRDGGGKPIRVVGSGVDITDLKRAGEVLRASEARFRALVQNSSDLISLFDAEGTVVYQAPSIERLLGYRPEDRIGRNVFSDPIVHPDDRAAKRAFFDAARSRPAASVTAEFRLRHADGSWRDIEAVGQNFLHDPGVAGIVANYRDITERKRAEEALRRQAELLRLSYDAIVVWRLGGGIETWSRGAEELYGIAEAEALGRVTHELLRTVHPVPWPEIEAELAAGGSWEGELRHRTKAGGEVIVSTRHQLVRDADGVRRVLESNRDITARKRAEEALRESERRFRTLAEALPVLVWTAEPDGAIDYVNARFTEYTGLALEQLWGWEERSTVYPEDQPWCHELWTRSIATGELFESEFRLRRADGAFRWHLSKALALRDDSGRITKWFGSCIDIDDQKRAQEALREAKEAAEAASRAKDEFLANVSHEIRTPMNAILGMTELALDTPLTGQQREYLAIVKSSADALLKVINDLLDFAKIEAGKLELDHTDFSLRQVLGETLRALAFRAHRKGLELACRIPPEVPDALIGDAGRLRQVLLNLVGNAIKFTEQGEVVVRVEAGVEPTSTEPDPSVPGSPPSQVLHFSISDTGIGIPREKQGRIFQAFEQVDSSTTRRYEGTGLGLSIAARLVELMGGQIAVESEPGRGSTFRFTAEFGWQPHPPGGPPERPLADLHGLRVLVVDDNATNRQILEEWLRGWHTEPLAVADGFRALDALWSAASLGRPFALVLLDVRMPGTDGLAVAESILQNPVLSKCRIILLTSEDLHGNIASYRELGIAAHVMKPVPQEELLEIIHRVLSRPDAAEAAVDRMGLIAAADSTAATPAPSARRLRILVAEDNAFNQQHVEHLLRRRGHDVRVASDGREALAALEQDRFDLMLLDVHMPGCDGFQVIEALRRREQATGGHLPVIALTARAMKRDRERCLQAGMDDYLAKPIAAADLFRVMDRVLVGWPAAEPVPPGRGRPETLLDPATLRASCDDDATLLRELIGVFQADTPGTLARVREAVQEGDAPRLREEAHRLRGLLSNFSATAAEAAARLEEMGAGEQLDAATSVLEGLTEMVGRLGPLLEDLSIEQLRHHDGGMGPA